MEEVGGGGGGSLSQQPGEGMKAVRLPFSGLLTWGESIFTSAARGGGGRGEEFRSEGEGGGF